jgi:hypothetical protein
VYKFDGAPSAVVEHYRATLSQEGWREHPVVPSNVYGIVAQFDKAVASVNVRMSVSIPTDAPATFRLEADA